MQTYYERNKERIHQYYIENRELLKQKALERYYANKSRKLESGELIPKRNKTSRKPKEPYEFKIEWMQTNLTSI